MPSTNKTQYLELCDWIGTDKPIRADFAEDNTKIDTAVGEHINDTDVHLSSSAQEWIANPCFTDVYMGTGESTQTYELTKIPKAVFVYLRNEPFSKVSANGEYTICNAAMATPSGGSSGGITLIGRRITLKQSASAPSAGGVFYNLGEEDKTYGIFAIN